jgi:hypothetical protein
MDGSQPHTNPKILVGKQNINIFYPYKIKIGVLKYNVLCLDLRIFW